MNSEERACLYLCGICKQFPGVKALDQVDLVLRRGSIHALLGENGAGKSTLINIVGGVLRPDQGTYFMEGQPVTWSDARQARAAGIVTVHQEIDLFPDLTIAENFAWEHGWPVQGLKIDWLALQQATRKALDLFGKHMDPSRPAVSLSPGDRQLLGIAGALAHRAAVLVLDEPTSSLSEAESEALFTHLRRFRQAGGAILYVSHRLEEVFALADEVTVLRDGRRVWHGPLQDITPHQLVASMVGRQAPFREQTPTTPGPVVLACECLTASDGIFRDVSINVRSGEVFGLYGLIGAGRTEWAQAIFGLRPVQSGRIELDGKNWRPRNPADACRNGIAYLPEDRLRLGLLPGLSVRANFVVTALRRLAFGPLIFSATENRLSANLVAQLQVRLRSLLQPIATLSGGNQQKVVLGRWLACEPKVLLLDEPTRGVDIGAKAEIHALLRRLAAAGRAVVLISSDLPEVLGLSDRVGVFRDGRLVAVHETSAVTAEQIAAAALPQGKPVSDTPETPFLHRRSWKPAFQPLREAGLLAAVVLLSLGLTLSTTTFWQPETLQDVGANAALLVLCGLGAAVVILSGAIDISFGAMMAVSAAVAGYLMQEGWSPAVGILAGLMVGTLAGAFNATLAILGRVHPIVVTLGTLSLYRGLTLRLIGGKAIHDLPAGFREPFTLAPLGIPMVIWLVAGVLTAVWVVLGWTVPGRQIFAQGGNPRAAARVGIRRGRVWLIVFAVEGFLAALAGLLALGMAGHLQGTDFSEMTLEAIGVAVVGGIAITGGRGSVWGLCSAALLFRVLEKGWALLHISPHWQKLIVGGLLLVAILGDRFWRRAEAG